MIYTKDSDAYPADAPPPPYAASNGQYMPGAYTPGTYPPSRAPSRSPVPPNSPPVAGPSSAGAGIGGFLKGLSGSEPSDLLNPPPPSFSRAPRRELPYTPFPPLTVLSLGSSLDKGFPALPPPTTVQPHPFAMHDVCEEDWVRFVGDIQKAGKLSPMNRIVAGVAPLAMGVGLAGIFISRAIENGMRKRKSAPATQIVDHWNHYFFWPRGMQVDLVHGRRVYTERETLPSDLSRAGYSVGAAKDSSSSSSSSSDSDSDSDHKHRSDSRRDRKAERQARREQKRARREERRARKRERRERKRDERKSRSEPWKLVITYRPLV